MGDGLWWDLYACDGYDPYDDAYDDAYDPEERRLIDRTVVRETQKAYLCSEGYWWPKSQCIKGEDGVLTVSGWIWDRKLNEPVPKKPNDAEPEIEWPF